MARVPAPAQTGTAVGVVTLDELRQGTVSLLVRAWRAARADDPDYADETRKHHRTVARRIYGVIGTLKMRDVTSVPRSM